MSTPLTPTSATPVSYTSDELHDSLVKWVSFTRKNRGTAYKFSHVRVWMLVLQLQNCLALGGTHTFDGTNLNDGLTISRCLSQLAPATFTAEWSQKIISETAGNWRLKVSSLASGGG